MNLFEPSEVRQLKLFAWFLAIINACIVGIGLMLGEKLDDPSASWMGMLAMVVLVDGAFGLIVSGNVVVVAIRRWRYRHRSDIRRAGR